MINKFFGPTKWLSNFYMTPITYEGITYPSTEHAYQAMKSADVADRLRIANLAKAGEAKREGMKVTLREDWEEVRLKIMYDINWLKFQDPILREALLETEGQELIEGNDWNDTFWGVCNGIGENNLGKILMEIREDIKRSL